MPARAAPAAVDVPPPPRVSVTALPALQQIRLDLPRVEAPQPDLMAGLRSVAPAGVGGGQGPGRGGGAGGGLGPGAPGGPGARKRGRKGVTFLPPPPRGPPPP